MGCQPGDFAYCHFNLPPGFVWVRLDRVWRECLFWSETCKNAHQLTKTGQPITNESMIKARSKVIIPQTETFVRRIRKGVNANLYGLSGPGNLYTMPVPLQVSCSAYSVDLHVSENKGYLKNENLWPKPKARIRIQQFFYKWSDHLQVENEQNTSVIGLTVKLWG